MFDSRFEVFLADTTLAHRLHYQIRYRVFCMDRGFEDPTKGSFDEERDHWDNQSVHFLVRERATGQWVATMRMIRPEAKPFPIESLCTLDLSSDLTYRRDASCEISRLCMIQRYRGRQGSRFAHGDDLSDGLDQRVMPEIMLGLFRAGMAYSRPQGLTNWYFLITPALARLIRRIGVSLTRMGKPVEHRGIRAPYLTDPFQSCEIASRQSARIARMFSRDLPAYRLFSEIHPEHKVA